MGTTDLICWYMPTGCKLLAQYLDASHKYRPNQSSVIINARTSLKKGFISALPDIIMYTGALHLITNVWAYILKYVDRCSNL